MRRLIVLLAALTGLLSGAEPGATPSPDPYLAVYQRIVTEQEAAITKRGPAERLWLADAALALAERTANPAYRTRAAGWFATALPEIATARSDFHSQRGLARILGPLQTAGLIAPADLPVLRRIATRTWDEFLAAPAGTPEGDTDHNIHLAQAMACAAFARFFAQDPTLDTGRIRARITAYWERISALGDLDEDASNYSALGLVHAIELAGVLGRTADLRQPAFRRMFARQRDLISPSGRLPEFGDGYFHLERDAFDYLYVCEFAAALFADPSYLAPARRMFDADSYAKALPDEWGRGIDLLRLARLSAEPGAVPASTVGLRAVRGQDAPVPDKLILRTGTAPGDAMIMLDLYAGGSHAHPAKGPSVAYYEADGVPLFHNLGRHRTRSAITGNSFWALPAAEEFPGVWKADTWFTMHIPAACLLHDAAGNLSLGHQLNLRTFDNRGTTRLWLDNLRLDGPGRSVLLDGFETPDGWSKNVVRSPGIDLRSDPLHTQGTMSQSLAIGALAAGGYIRTLADARDLTCSPRDVTALKLDVRYTGVRPYLHLRELVPQIDLGDHALPYRIASATTEQRGRDAAGAIVFASYIADDAHLVRRLVLSREGILVIHDRWTAGAGPTADAAAWNAGQLWQLYALAERGPDWFASEDDGTYQVLDAGGSMRPVRRRMLVKFALPPPARTICETLVQPYHCPTPRNRPATSFVTLGSVQRVAAGAITTATMAVVPQDPEQPATPAAAGIQLVAAGDVTTVLVTRADTTITIRLAGDDHWEISRAATVSAPGGR